MGKNSKAKKRIADLKALSEAAEGSLVIGIDVGDRFSEICVLNQTGGIVEKGRIQTSGQAVHEQFSALKAQRVAMETGTHSPWLSAVVASCGHEVIVANARKLRLIYENDQKSDEVDAFTLADLARTNTRLLYPVQHRSAEAQRDLAVLRSREELVSIRTALINHARGVVKSHGQRLPNCAGEVFGARVREQIPEQLRGALSGVLETADAVEEQIYGYERQLEHMAATKYPEVALLRQIDGVGLITALAFRLTIDDASRFQNSRSVGAYLGLVTQRRQSGERDPELGISKAGDELVRKLLVNCAHHILGPFGKDSALRRWGLKLMAGRRRGGRKRAAVAVARKLAVLMHHLWVSGEVYEPLRGCAASPAESSVPTAA